MTLAPALGSTSLNIAGLPSVSHAVSSRSVKNEQEEATEQPTPTSTSDEKKHRRQRVMLGQSSTSTHQQRSVCEVIDVDAL